MNILIIGSKGFIGTHASNFFQEKKHTVFGCDVVTDYTEKRYFQIDATNSDYQNVFKNNIIDVCINCSGAASVPLSLEFPLKDFNLNTLNVFKIADAIRLYQPSCKFINLSSAAVYGNPESLPIKESFGLKPLSPYGIHKMQAEQVLTEFNTFYNLKTCSVRIFSAYGNGLKKQLLWDLYHKFSSNKPIELYGTGDESRDFIHVSDVVQAIALIIEEGTFDNQQINVANGQEFTIRYIAETFKSILNVKQNIVFNNKVKKGDPLNWCADISKLKALGYQNKVSIENGIEDYINWIEKNMN
ncbi:MAG: NAD-dependent epimerase/dehydratase family protein [Flavobacterium sp.]|uniref:NAD-dependent epimerase/dehydratase family protein n=1 Tax=Flavobacterium sp. TaxID=239 RepID=UPI002B53B9A8|nr:NAD-dependent epimerase/dehydratase family protein [Flavobacterium sp.]HQA73647.1 NAD-dependent epimerase/dehydratase family protein [Flavobacterium sp.]